MNTRTLLLFTFTFIFTFTSPCTFTHVHAAYFDINTCTSQTPCIHVAPNGSDNNTGTISSPFRTIQRAFSFININNHTLIATTPVTVTSTTIVLNDGVYPGGIVWTGSNITLTSISGASSTFIDCAHIPNQRGIWIGSGETSSTIVSGITIQNCITTMGGGMAVVGETTKPTIRDVVFSKNEATMGGGMLIFFASPSLFGCNFTGNGGRDGAGLMITHNASLIIPKQRQFMSLALDYVNENTKPLPSGATASVSITRSTFTENVATGIGASYYLMAAYRVSCSRCTFVSGRAAGSGAIAAGTRSMFSISDSMFMDNSAIDLNGGAISIQQGSTGTITRSTFQNNQATNLGGGVAVGQGGSAMITNCQFNNNRANMGSIVYIDETARAQVTGCTCTNNVAFQQGGILYLSPLSARAANMSRNTFSNNRALGGYGADYGSFPSRLVFVPDNSTVLGSSDSTPSLVPHNVTTQVTRSVNNLDKISLRILLLDTFGQRLDVDSSNQTDLYADVKTLDNNTVPALLVSSTRVKMPKGAADVSVILVGEAGKTYAVTWSVDILGVQSIRLLVTILPCEPQAVITYYDQTTFPICNPAASHFISSSFFNGIVIISGILIALVLIVQGLTIWFWNTPVFKTSTPLFMSLMLVGAIVGYLSVILSVIDVDRTSDGLSLFNQICKTQYWMMGVAFVLMFATLALKTWRIRNIFCNSTLTEIRTVDTWALFRWLMVFVAIEMLIHAVWISVDPLHAVMRLTGTRIAATCESSHDTAFLITNLAYKGVIALVCVLFAYQTRDVTSRFNESRQLMIASYNMFVSVIVIATLSLALPDVDARRTVYSVGALFVITSTWFVLFFPKLYLLLFPSEQNSSLGIATATGKNSNSGLDGKNSNSGGNRLFSLKKGNSSSRQQSSSKLLFHNINTVTGPTSSSSATATATASPTPAANSIEGSPIAPTKFPLHIRSSMSTTTAPSLSTPAAAAAAVTDSNSPPTTFRDGIAVNVNSTTTSTTTTPHIHAMPTSNSNDIPLLDLKPGTTIAHDATAPNNEPGAAASASASAAAAGEDNLVHTTTIN